jgi:hypothetical protein
MPLQTCIKFNPRIIVVGAFGIENGPAKETNKKSTAIAMLF